MFGDLSLFRFSPLFCREDGRREGGGRALEIWLLFRPEIEERREMLEADGTKDATDNQLWPLNGS